ncbi:MAG TPA: hypothetical protein VD767_00380, partial [Thermomicrobiales bacterium]|nr:hypothetical protein [Thermomicrobiales bacterium]
MPGFPIARRRPAALVNSIQPTRDHPHVTPASAIARWKDIPLNTRHDEELNDELEPFDDDIEFTGEPESKSRTPEYIPSAFKIETALLVSVETPNQAWDASESLEELARLAESVDVQVVGSISQKLQHPHPGTYVGKGKLAEIKDVIAELAADIVMIDGDLSPGQQRNLERDLDV